MIDRGSHSKALCSNSNDYELVWSQILAIVVASIVDLNNRSKCPYHLCLIDQILM